MIRYPIAEDDLLARIEDAAPGWLGRARRRTAKFRRAGKYTEKSGIWTEIKPVFMRLQHNKCVFCERRLEGEPYGTIEHDVEHFRPKSSVRAWPDARVAATRGAAYDFPTGKAYPAGYYLLAYAPLNYATACKPCNTPLKSNFFPILGSRGRQSDDPRRYATEKPLLIYPIGDVDADDPEDLITFHGILPLPKHKSGDKHRRAVVTIDFFELDTREDLLRGRAAQLTSFYSTRQLKRDPTTARLLRALVAPGMSHAGCTRAFARLCGEDPVEARTQYEAAADYLASHS